MLLSRSRSIEADRSAFNTPTARRELFPDAIAMMDDILLSLRDLLAVFPAVREIEAEQLALAVQRNAQSIKNIRRNSEAIQEAAAASDGVAERAAAALKEHDPDIESARSQVVRARLVAAQLLVIRNFGSEVVNAARAKSQAASTRLGPPLRRAGKELSELGGESWKEFKENFPRGVGIVGRLIPTGIFIGLAATIAGPVAGLAALSGGFKELAKALGKMARGKEKPRKKKKASKKTSSMAPKT
jgi:hypothetical protein